MDAASVATTKVGRNDPCPCRSGKKFKQCCQGKDASADLFYSGGSMSPPGGQGQKHKLEALTRAAKEHWAAERYDEAVAAFREIVRLQPKSPQAHFNLGEAMIQCGRLMEGAVSFERAIELRPGYFEAHHQLANALELAGKESEALPIYRRLSRLADNTHDKLFYSAKTLAAEGKLDDAEEKLSRLLVLSPELAATRLAYGQMLLDRGKFAEAEAQIVQTIDTIPLAFETLTRVRRMGEADRPTIDRMRAVVTNPRLHLESRIAIGFGLGKAFDDLGDYAEAMRQYDQANALRAKTTRLDRSALVADYDRLIANYSREALESAARSPASPANSEDELPVFVVGMPRSGTTLTEQILSSHPKVAGAGELPFWKGKLRVWGRGSTAPDHGSLSAAVKEYSALLRSHGPEALRVVDKAPRNFELLWLIRLAFPNARIIHCRRAPIDTSLSIYFSYFWAHQTYAFDRDDIVFFYRQYERLMAHWRSVLPADRFTEVDYETLVADPEAETRRLIAFCGLDWDDACLTPEQNRRSVKTASVWQARQPVYKSSVERWRRYEPWLGELRELLPEANSAGVGTGG